MSTIRKDRRRGPRRSKQRRHDPGEWRTPAQIAAQARIDLRGNELGTHTGEEAAALLGPVLEELDAAAVVCGDMSADIGSGTVPTIAWRSIHFPKPWRNFMFVGRAQPNSTRR